MQIFIAALIGALVQAAGTLVGKILLSLGIGYMSYVGIDSSITFARDFFVSKITALDPQTVAVAGALQVGRCVSILTSALIARMTIKGTTGGALKRFTIK